MKLHYYTGTTRLPHFLRFMISREWWSCQRIPSTRTFSSVPGQSGEALNAYHQNKALKRRLFCSSCSSFMSYGKEALEMYSQNTSPPWTRNHTHNNCHPQEEISPSIPLTPSFPQIYFLPTSSHRKQGGDSFYCHDASDDIYLWKLLRIGDFLCKRYPIPRSER